MIQSITTCVPEPPIPDLRVHPNPNAPDQYPPKEAFASSKYECDPKSPLLKPGSKGEKVVELQTYLADLGYAAALQPEGIDGKFGPHPKNSVMQYQKERMADLHSQFDEDDIDGKVGPKTWEMLCIDAYLWFQNSSYYFKHFR